MSRANVNSVFYADTYHPIQAGSIDGTDIVPHDNAVYRALLCSSAGLYDPFGDPKVIGDPYCTVFVGRLSHCTTEESLRKAMSKYGRVKNLRLVRDIVTGASRGYAFVEYETEREMRRSYKDAHHSYIDDSEIMVDYNRQQLMPGWIPRRLGGGLGGRKESGQLRFGGRERPFRAPLQSIPLDDLKRLGIPPPPEGRYMSCFQVPSPPRRNRSSIDREESSRMRSSIDKEEHSHRSSSAEREERYNKRSSRGKEEHTSKQRSKEREERYHKGRSLDSSGHSHKKISLEKEKHHEKSSPLDREETPYKRSSDLEAYPHTSSKDRKEGSHKRHRHDSRSDRHKRKRSRSRDR
ncbi:hypothetical protein JCGZ_23763 [Jatropha curcas]|uniref:RRM domain-containing protein n=1 Tax=Jatropha curcas TaxID=180498 RepID=A0A067L2Z0_JATCU|nr:U11/U12 small nuclear ribonucleoprotein 35 kDa protein [Jatropha curcas]KDP42821.1 hypothetical protein JCGZ_23763 [Jatropha curcas]